MKRLALFLLFFFVCVDADAAARFAVCTATCTWDASSTAMWSASTGGSTGASVPGTSDTVTLDGATCVGGVTCTITVNTNVTVISITMGACTATTTGCILDFSANNNSVALSLSGTAFSGTGSGTRTLKMGTNTWTLSGAGAIWDITTKTNLTLTPGSSSIVFSNVASTSARSFISAALTYNAVTVGSNTSSGTFTFSFAGATVTIPTLTLTGPSRVRISNASTLATTTMSATGTSTALIQLQTDSTGAIATVSSASNQTFNWADIWDITCSGGGTFTANSSFNSGNNTGITINAPVTTTSGGIIGGWLLRRDLVPSNDNWPAFLNKAA